MDLAWLFQNLQRKRRVDTLLLLLQLNLLIGRSDWVLEFKVKALLLKKERIYNPILQISKLIVPKRQVLVKKEISIVKEVSLVK